MLKHIIMTLLSEDGKVLNEKELSLTPEGLKEGGVFLSTSKRKNSLQIYNKGPWMDLAVPDKEIKVIKFLHDAV
jgi:hypothetical protein